MKRQIVSVLFLGWFAATPAWAGFSFTEKNPTVGKETTVKITNKKKLPIQGARLIATYYPNSKLKREELVKGMTDTGGLLKWKPSSPGIVKLAAQLPNGKDKEGKAKYKTVSSTSIGVKFAGMPLSGLLVFLVAGGLLFGGMLFGFYRAFGSE